LRIFPSALILLGLLTVLLAPQIPHLVVASDPATIHVPQDYPTIQAAVSAANPGDTIIVSSTGSPYAGNITIDKSLSLLGASASSTIIDGGGTTPGLLVNSTSNVEVSGFTIRNSDSTDSELAIVSSTNVTVSGNILVSTLNPPGNGTFVANSNLVVVRNNVVTGNIYGIAVQGGFSNVIQSNNVTGNRAADLYLGNTTGDRVSNNILRISQSGLDVWDGSTGNTVSRNTVANNTLAGVWMISSANNLVVNNNIDWNNATSNSIGVYLQSTSGNQFYYNNIRHNGVQLYGVYSTDMVGNVWNDMGNIPRGNFWSDYRGLDNDTDEIGDTSIPWPCPTGGHPCTVFGGPAGVDYYPLMNATKLPVLNVTVTALPLSGCSVPSPLRISFNSSVQGGSPPYQYSWRFGDNTLGGNATTLTHQYTARGELFATLTVNDSSIPANSVSEIVSITSFSGGLALRLKDSSGNPVSGANVTSTSQPPGLAKIYQVTNSTGIAYFPCLPPGVYSFQVSRQGYQTLRTSLTITNSILAQSITLSQTTSQNSFPLYLLEYVGIAATLSLIVVLIVLLRHRMKRQMGSSGSARP